MKQATLLPVIIIGVAIGTLIALYVAAQVAKRQLAQSGNSGTAAALAGLSGLLNNNA